MLGGEGAWLSPGGMSVDTAKLWYIPPTTCVMPLRPSTCTGVLRLVVVPTCPSKLAPQAHTVPSSFSARLWLKPPATSLTPLRSLTCTGVVRSVVVQSPSCPFSLYPQAQTLGLGKLVPGGGAAVVNDQLLGWSPEVFGSWSSWLPARSQAPLTVTV